MNTKTPSSTTVNSQNPASEMPAFSTAPAKDDAIVARPEMGTHLLSQTTQGGVPADPCAPVGHIVLEAAPLETESAVFEPKHHHFEAGCSRPKPAQQQNPTPQQDAAEVVWTRIYFDGNVPPNLTGTQLYEKFKKEWDRDPELAERKRPSKSTALRKLGKKKH